MKTENGILLTGQGLKKCLSQSRFYDFLKLTFLFFTMIWSEMEKLIGHSNLAEIG
jgi:hypothetical protein